MAFRLFVDSSTGVTVTPEFNMSDGGEKIESRHRMRDGSEFVYKWGEFDKKKIDVRFVNSEFKSLVNDWWSDNIDLLWIEDRRLDEDVLDNGNFTGGLDGWTDVSIGSGSASEVGNELILFTGSDSTLHRGRLVQSMNNTLGGTYILKITNTSPEVGRIFVDTVLVATDIPANSTTEFSYVATSSLHILSLYSPLAINISCNLDNVTVREVLVEFSDVTSVHITNKKKPIDKFQKPYDNLFNGKIELGTY